MLCETYDIKFCECKQSFVRVDVAHSMCCKQTQVKIFPSSYWIFDICKRICGVKLLAYGGKGTCAAQPCLICSSTELCM